MEGIAELWLRLAVLGLAGVAGEFLLRRANGAVRHALWVVVVGAALALPVARAAFEERTWTVSWWRVRAMETGGVATTLPEAVSGSTQAARSRPARGAAVSYEWLLYAIVAAALLARQAQSALRLREIERTASPVEPEEALDVAAKLSLVEQVEFLTSERIEVPFTTGWKRCRIFLPADWAGWTAAKRIAVLAHEMAHVQRKDWLIGRAAAVVRAIFWAHPLFWWAERRLAALAEEAVDETALALMGDPRAYAGAILDFALARTEQFEVMETTAMARTSKAGSRVERILSNRNFSIARMGKLTAAGMVAAALPLLYAAALVEPAPQPPRAPAPNTIFRVAAVAPEPAQTPASKGELAAAEARFAANPDAPLARLELIHKYIQAGRRDEAESHTVWLVENHPARPETMAATQFFVNHFGPAPAGRRLSELWRSNAEKYPGDTSVLTSAARMAQMEGEYARADALLRQALTLDPESRKAQFEQAALYLLALLAGSGVAVTPSQPEAAFIETARRLADSGTEMPLVGAVGELLIPSDSLVAQSEQAAEHARKSRAERIRMAEGMLRRAGELDPDNQRWKTAMERLQRAKAGSGVVVQPLPASEAGIKRVTVGGNVQASMLVKSVEPQYPPVARQARIQGTVRFSVVIDKAGRVSSMRLISGHPLLVQAAQEALQKYEYKPTTLGGEPVEVATQVDINFTLGPPEQVQ